MRDYNHEADSLNEAVGIDGKATALRAGELLGDDEMSSRFVEVLETKFTKRELAFMASMFIFEMMERSRNPQDRPEIKVMSMDGSDLPPEVKEALDSFIKDEVYAEMDKENPDSFDPECSCPRCTANREKAIKAGKFTTMQFKSHGDC